MFAPVLSFHRGVNFTAESPEGYTARIATPVLTQLRSYGVNTIALVPYAFHRPGATAIRFGGKTWESDEQIEEVAAVARNLGFSIFLKPQIWSRGASTTNIAFSSPGEVADWFDQYGRYAVHQAERATIVQASLFCAGMELPGFRTEEKHWRTLIRRVRRVFRGPITYGAAQGPEFEEIAFWDDLDYIGLNNYYPLPSTFLADQVKQKVLTVQRRFRKPVLLPEVGYVSMSEPYRQPWDETPRPLALMEQARCYEAIFRAFYREPWFAGMYWWKIGTDGHGGGKDGSFTPWEKPAMEVVGQWYRGERKGGPAKR